MRVKKAGNILCLDLHLSQPARVLPCTGVDGEHVPPALQRFPEVLALDVDRQLRANIETLQTQWFVRGLALKKLLRSQPQVCSPASAQIKSPGPLPDAFACIPVVLGSDSDSQSLQVSKHATPSAGAGLQRRLRWQLSRRLQSLLGPALTRPVSYMLPLCTMTW